MVGMYYVKGQTEQSTDRYIILYPLKWVSKKL